MCNCCSRFILTIGSLFILLISGLTTYFLVNYPNRGIFLVEPGTYIDFHHYGYCAFAIITGLIGLKAFVCNDRRASNIFIILLTLMIAGFLILPHWSPSEPTNFKTEDFLQDIRFLTFGSHPKFFKITGNYTGGKPQEQIACCGPSVTKWGLRKVCYNQEALKMCSTFYEDIKNLNISYRLIFTMIHSIIYIITWLKFILCNGSNRRGSRRIQLEGGNTIDYHPRFIETKV